MKKLFLLSAFIILCNITTYAQRKNVVKVNPFSAVLKTFSGFYEHAFNDKMSFQIGLGYTFPYNFSTNDFNPNIEESARFTVFSVMPEFRYYITHSNYPAPKGFYVGPFMRYRLYNLAVRYEDFDFPEFNYAGNLDIIHLSFGGVMGYQAFAGERVAFDFFGGPFYRNVSFKYADSDGNELTHDDTEVLRKSLGLKNGFGFRLGIAVGFAF